MQPKGSLAEQPFSSLLPNLFLERANGVLFLEQANQQKKIFFVDGMPVGAASNIRTETLGHFLQQRGKISPQDLEKVIQYMLDKQVIQGRALIELGFLQENELFPSLQLQTFEKIVHAFTWRDGSYEFATGLEQFAQEMCFPLNIQDIYSKGMILSLGEEGIKKQVRDILKEDPRTRKLEEWLDALASIAFGVSRAKQDEVIEKSNKQKEWEEMILSTYLNSRKMNFFELLGVAQEASQQEVKQAYYTLAKKFHPDRYRGRIRSEVMRILEHLFGQFNEANQTLTHPESRKIYLSDTLPRYLEAADHQSKRHEQVIHAEALCLKGDEALRLKEYPEAIKLFQEAHDRDPHQPHYEMLLAWAQVHAADGKTEEARERCKSKCAAVLRVDSNWSRAHHFLGVLLLEEGQQNAAIHELQQALRFAPNDPDVLATLKSALETSKI